MLECYFLINFKCFVNMFYFISVDIRIYVSPHPDTEHFLSFLLQDHYFSFLSFTNPFSLKEIYKMAMLSHKHIIVH